MTRLAAAVFTLISQESGQVPAWSGHDARQWFLNTVQQYNPALSYSLQNGSGPRPFTTSGLLGIKRARQGASLPAGIQCWLRITTLQDELTDLLVEHIVPGAPGSEVMAGGIPFSVEAATVDPAKDRGAGASTEATLVQQHTLESTVARYIGLQFTAPTAFKSGPNAHTLFPMPDLVFGSLLARWNAFNVVKLHPDAPRFAGECVAVSRYQLRTSYITLQVGGQATGFKGFQGFARFVFLRGDRYWRGLISTLAAYSFYAGVGTSTTMGCGQARPRTCDNGDNAIT